MIFGWWLIEILFYLFGNIDFDEINQHNFVLEVFGRCRVSPIQMF